MQALPTFFPGLFSPLAEPREQLLYQQRSDLVQNVLGGAAAGAAAGPLGAGIGAGVGLLAGFMNAGYDPAGGGEIRRQLQGEDPGMVNAIIAWARTNRPGWYSGTESIWDDTPLLHSLEDDYRASVAAAAKQSSASATWKKVAIGAAIVAGLVLLIGAIITLSHKRA